MLLRVSACQSTPLSTNNPKFWHHGQYQGIYILYDASLKHFNTSVDELFCTLRLWGHLNVRSTESHLKCMNCQQLVQISIQSFSCFVTLSGAGQLTRCALRCKVIVKNWNHLDKMRYGDIYLITDLDVSLMLAMQAQPSCHCHCPRLDFTWQSVTKLFMMVSKPSLLT